MAWCDCTLSSSFFVVMSWRTICLGAQSAMGILIHKPTRIWLIIPEEVVMQPRLTVSILVLQSEGLVSSSRYLGFTLQFTPTIIIPEPQEAAVFIGHLSLDADLLAVEVVGLLVAFAIFADVV